MRDRRKILILGLAIVLLAATTALVLHLRSPKSSSSKLNVLIFVVDTLAAKHMGLYGYNRPTTPFLQEFAKDAFVFNRAFATAPHTLPSQASLFTGTSVAVHQMRDSLEGRDPLDTRLLTMPQILKTIGYATAWFALMEDDELDLHRGFERGIDFFDSTGDRTLFLDKARENWIRQHRNQPKYFFFHTYMVHDPYLSDPPFYGKFDPDYNGALIGARAPFQKELQEYLKTHPWREPGQLDYADRRLFFSKADVTKPREVQHLAALYDDAILQMDDLFRQFIDRLKVLGLYDDSIIVFTSDHGEQFGEHDGLMHEDLTQEVLQIPLIIRVPGHAPGSTDIEVQNLDVLPTILDFLQASVPSSVEGKSLRPLMEGGQTPVHDLIFAQFDDNIVSVQDSRWKAIFRRNDMGKGRLYDHATDWYEKHDLAVSQPKKHEEMLEKTQRYLLGHAISQ